MLRIDNIRHEGLRDVEHERVEEHLGALLDRSSTTGAMRVQGVGLEREIDEVGDRQGDEEGGDEPEGEWGPEVLAEQDEEVGQGNSGAVVGHVADGRDLAGRLQGDQCRSDAEKFDQETQRVDGERGAEGLTGQVRVLGDSRLLVGFRDGVAQQARLAFDRVGDVGGGGREWDAGGEVGRFAREVACWGFAEKRCAASFRTVYNSVSIS